MHTKFYHGTTKKMMVAFSSMFDDIRIDLDDGREVLVPLHYAQGEKFIASITQYEEKNSPGTKPIAMPVMGYELISMNYAPERHTGSLNKIQDRRMQSERAFMYNKTPIDFQFDLYIAVKRINDGLKIIEQIIPFFTPHLNLRVRGIDDMDQPTNIPVTLTSYSSDILTDGSMDEMRSIIYQLSFTMKGFLYPDVKRFKTIQEATINFNEEDFDRKFMQITAGLDDQGKLKTTIKE